MAFVISTLQKRRYDDFIAWGILRDLRKREMLTTDRAITRLIDRGPIDVGIFSSQYSKFYSLLHLSWEAPKLTSETSLVVLPAARTRRSETNVLCDSNFLWISLPKSALTSIRDLQSQKSAWQKLSIVVENQTTNITIHTYTETMSQKNLNVSNIQNIQD